MVKRLKEFKTSFRQSALVGFLLIVAGTLNGCDSGATNTDKASGNAYITVTMPIAAAQDGITAQAFGDVTSIIITVTDNNGKSSSGDILKNGGSLTLSIRPYIEFTVSAVAYEGSTATYEGNSGLQSALRPGQVANISFSLNAIAGPGKPVAPSITGQPSSQSVSTTAPVTFSVGATGSPVPSYQWQISTDYGVTWNDINGATASTYTVPTATQSDSGSQYRVVVTNTLGSSTSDAAILSVTPLSYLPVGGFDITNSYEPWVTDGTSLGALLLKDVNTNNNPPVSGDSDPHNYVVYKGLTYFVARSGEPLYLPEITPYDLWSTDGNPANTQLVLTNVNSFIEFNGSLYLSHDDGTSGYQLYKFNEQTKTATLIPGLDGFEMPRDLYVAGNTLYFDVQAVGAPYNPSGGGADTVLWKFDGESAHPVPGLDQRPAASSYYRVHKIMADIGNKLVMAMGADSELQVFITDGTTSVLTTTLTNGNVKDTAILNGAVYFLANSFKDAGGSPTVAGSPTGYTADLYKTDVIQGTTEVVTRVFTGTFIGNGYSYSYGLHNLLAFNGRLYFYAENTALNNSGVSCLASSDGVSGSPLTYYPEVWNSSHGPLRVINNQLYVFTNELWQVDGATPGATQLTTVCGTTDWQCNDHFFDVLLDFNGKVVFFAREEHILSDGVNFSPVVDNLYMYDPTSTTLAILKDNLCGGPIGSVCQSTE